ncbi:MAG: efflux RND transporter periplasmic adaptor subunit [Candidatus Marinimicrobia bacterium]|nr:efflux RND transporter periplasmic adaptor subunit [Candidatus Neomarinimicrobiota bacterium]MDD5540201.1 efflux RND transporter periplasmic adaptor subunit [Candidatus Neomarinimicrobiota bacterium]
MKKKAFFSIAIIFVLILGWRITLLVTTANKKSSGNSGRPPVAVEVDSVRFGPLTEVRQLTGTIYPRYQYIVAPKVSGRIIKIQKRIGDWIKAGEIIANLDDAEYQQGVMEAEANLKIAEATQKEARIQLDQARQEKKRVESLHAKGIAAPAELEAAVSNYSALQSRLQLAQAQVEQRRASLRSAKIRLSYTVLTANQPGYVGERYVDEGALLAPNTPVVSIIGIDSVIVRTTIIERDYGYIQVGMPTTVSVDAYSGEYFTGIVARIAPLLQEAARVAQVEIEVTNDQMKLKPGMFTRVEIITATRENTQIVPSQAVVNRNGENYIFLVDENGRIARSIPVTTGIVTPKLSEIVAPALTGNVITLGQHLLEDGSPIIISRSATFKAASPDSAAGEKRS